jgi:hypothetical protein
MSAVGTILTAAGSVLSGMDAQRRAREQAGAQAGAHDGAALAAMALARNNAAREREKYKTRVSQNLL